MLMPPLLAFPWHCDAICPGPLHLKQRISQQTLRIQLSSLSWRSCKQSFAMWRIFLSSLHAFDSEGVRLVEAAANSAGPSLSLIVSIPDEARCGSPETNARVKQRSSRGPPTSRASRRSSVKNSSTVSPGRSFRVTNWSYAYG